MSRVGIHAVEIYIPVTYVDQAELEMYDGVSTGKYTKGLGQKAMAVTEDWEDVNSMCLTVVSRLLKKAGCAPHQVGRVEVGTQTLVDKAKSTKTTLMQLFGDSHDIEGCTTINACYGGTAALLNSLDWMSSPSWDGRLAIVVTADIAVYSRGPARCTGGAGAIAMLIAPNASIEISPIRSSYMDHQYDFYKPNPHSQYPLVDGKYSIDCYMTALSSCYNLLKRKVNKADLLATTDYFCFHTPFSKMVQKAYTTLSSMEHPTPTQGDIDASFLTKVHPSLFLSQQMGNMYTASLYGGLLSLLLKEQHLSKKQVLLFSYGSGLCSSMLMMTIHQNPLSKQEIHNINQRIHSRAKISPVHFHQKLDNREANYGNMRGKISVNLDALEDQMYYLDEIDQKLRRQYRLSRNGGRQAQKSVGRNANSATTAQEVNSRPETMRVVPFTKQVLPSAQQVKSHPTISNRLANIKNTILPTIPKFSEMGPDDRIGAIESKIGTKLDANELQGGGLSLELANTMIENVIGMVSLPLSVIPEITINGSKCAIPMCIEEPSVVAACSSIGKFLHEDGFHTKSNSNVMIGQLYLPTPTLPQIKHLASLGEKYISVLNQCIPTMVERGGGVIDLCLRELTKSKEHNYVVEIFVDVCDAMGANLVNTLCEYLKGLLTKEGFAVGIAILSNYCTERIAEAWFEIPVEHLARKGMSGETVAEKIVQAYKFAQQDPYRASTHNKGIMNGIDAVCLATGQDWRAVEAAAHTYASRFGQYQPLTTYHIKKEGSTHLLKGTLKLPIAVGVVGGALNKNPIYKQNLQIIGASTSRSLSETMVCVGLAQNFAALRALAVEGIQSGHMKLHARTLAQKYGIPNYLLAEACEYMFTRKQYDNEALREFMQAQQPHSRL